MKVLVVEDEQKLASLIMRGLKGEGFSVDTGIVENERKPGQINQSIEQILDNFRELSEAENLIIEFEKENDYEEVNGDAQLLRQVVYNLVQNAVKFNRSSGMTNCRAGTKEEHLLITMGNDGKAIAEKDHEKIFDRFW